MPPDTPAPASDEPSLRERPDEGLLRERLEALGESAASLAHTLRSPLASMELLCGLLKERLSDPACLELVEELRTEQRLIATAVDGCLDWVREAPLRPRPTPLRGLLQEAFEVARLRVPFGGRVELSPGPDLVARVDPEAFRAALVDVLVNALQALDEQPPAAPRVSLQLAAEPDWLRVEIRDNGPGIPPEAQQRIFQPFFTTRSRGTGLGLPHVRKVVRAHGGRIEVESAPGQGTCLRVWVPREPETGPPGEAARRRAGG